MAAYIWDIVTDSLQTTGSSSPSFITSGLQQTPNKPTQLENQIKDIVISAYSSKNPTSPKPTSPHIMAHSSLPSPSQQPVIYSADDTANSPTSTLNPYSFKPPQGSGSILSTVQANVPIALQGDDQENKRGSLSLVSSIASNLSDLDKSMQLMYSPHDPQPINYLTSSPLLHNSFSLPRNNQVPHIGNDSLTTPLTRREENNKVTTPLAKREEDNHFSLPLTRREENSELPSPLISKERKGSVCSEPINNDSKSVSPTTPTPSLPGDVMLRMPAHLKSSRSLNLSLSSTQSSPAPSSVSTPTQERAHNWSRVTDSVPINAHQIGNRLQKGNVPQNDEGVTKLKQQLNQLMKEKANLEGQLESVIDECQTTLSERAQLQTKLAQTEVELTSLQSETKNQKSLNNVVTSEEEGSDLKVEMDRLESTLSAKRRELADKNREIEKEKQKVKQLTNSLQGTQNRFEEKQKLLQQTQANLSKTKIKLSEKDDAIAELKSNIATLKTSLNNLEKSKKSLRRELEELQEDNMNYSQKFKRLKTSEEEQSLHLEKLESENHNLRKQLGQLQRAFLEDKMKIVNDLEVIQSDVSNKEEEYIKTKEDRDKLESEMATLARQCEALTAELKEKELLNSELIEELKPLKLQNKSLTNERDELMNTLDEYKVTLELKEQENQELTQAKNTLHKRLQEAQTALVSKEGQLQEMQDEYRKREYNLHLLEADKEEFEDSFTKATKDALKYKTDYDLVLQQKDKLMEEIREMETNSTQSTELISSLKSELSQKENESRERDVVIEERETNIRCLRDICRTLEEQAKELTSKNERLSSLIEHNKSETEQKLALLLEREEKLKLQIDNLQKEKARLEGELETAHASSPSLDDFKKVHQEKNELDSKLASERLHHQQELIKTQAKVARLDTELKDLKKDMKKREEGLRKEIETSQLQIDQLSQELEDTKEMSKNSIIQEEPSKDEIDGLNETLQERDETINNLKQEIMKLKNEFQQNKKELEEKLEEDLQMTKDDYLHKTMLLEKERTSERELFESEKQQLVMETERLKGRLAGIDKSQACRREHTSSLEKALAQKETQLTKLNKENERILASKSKEVTQLQLQLSEIKDQESSLKLELEKVLNDALLERQRGDEMERQLEVTKSNTLLTNTSMESSEEIVEVLKERISELERREEEYKYTIASYKTQFEDTLKENEQLSKKLKSHEANIEELEEELLTTQRSLQETQIKLEELQGEIQTEKTLNQQLTTETSSSEEEEEREKEEEIASLKNQLGNKSKAMGDLQSYLHELRKDMEKIKLQTDSSVLSLMEAPRPTVALKTEGRIRRIQGRGRPVISDDDDDL